MFPFAIYSVCLGSSEPSGLGTLFLILIRLLRRTNTGGDADENEERLHRSSQLLPSLRCFFPRDNLEVPLNFLQNHGLPTDTVCPSPIQYIVHCPIATSEQTQRFTGVQWLDPKNFVTTYYTNFAAFKDNECNDMDMCCGRMMSKPSSKRLHNVAMVGTVTPGDK
ncbi:hypothetical protein T265_04444 [Opisthorchis viverrini]|uniref:Uncharacterized protein n=1 Tax=Opisthorchis viverrini TaxID=6198 RepID=A0A074ZZP2_OPIVI|nr:hypothetical protein T265_04444 [Opisthorchis viverrini]KER28750.1 hypothetical protein T265_04444 [Opisthorchis viverrini]